MGNNKQHVTDKYVTGKGELVGFIALTKPSTKFNKEGVYTVNILLPKEEGEALYQKIKDIRTEQFKTYGKGTKVADITKCKPYFTSICSCLARGILYTSSIFIECYNIIATISYNTSHSIIRHISYKYCSIYIACCCRVLACFV